MGRHSGCSARVYLRFLNRIYATDTEDGDGARRGHPKSAVVGGRWLRSRGPAAAWMANGVVVPGAICLFLKGYFGIPAGLAGILRNGGFGDGATSLFDRLQTAANCPRMPRRSGSVSGRVRQHSSVGRAADS